MLSLVSIPDALYVTWILNSSTLDPQLDFSEITSVQWPTSPRFGGWRGLTNFASLSTWPSEHTRGELCTSSSIVIGSNYTKWMELSELILKEVTGTLLGVAGIWPKSGSSSTTSA